MSDKKPVEDMTAVELVAELEGYGYNCLGGPLENAAPWERLKQLVADPAAECEHAAVNRLAMITIGAEAGETLTEACRRLNRDRRNLEFRAGQAERQLAGQIERNAFLSKALSEYVIQLGQANEQIKRLGEKAGDE